MTDTGLLTYIREEMKRQGVVWKKEQELFEMLIPNEVWKKYKTSWSTWKHEKVHYLQKSPHIRLAIGQTLFFSTNIWGASDLVQKEAVVQGIRQAFVETKSSLPDWNSIIPTFNSNAEQEELLLMLHDLSLDEMEEKFTTYTEYFEQSFDNQAFLVKLLDLLYAKGAYDLLVEKVFPNLLPHKRSELRVKVMEAHSLGSLKKPKYMQSVKLLESIKSSSEKKVIDLKTSMLSNLRRYYAQNENLGIVELQHGMETMARMYYELFLYEKQHHYYPAINLVYVLQILNELLAKKSDIDVQEVYQKAKKSIKKEKISKNINCLYYAEVTELEFLLLLGHKGVEKKMEYMLKSQMPSLALVHRTKRQMIEFIDMAKRVKVDLAMLLVEFEKVIVLLEDYEKASKNGK